MRQKSALANHLLYLSKAMQSYDFLLNPPNIFVIIFQLFYKLLFCSGLDLDIWDLMLKFLLKTYFELLNFTF